MPSPYKEIEQQIARTTQAIREYRLHVVLRLLLKEKNKAAQVKVLEHELENELSKRLQSAVAIDTCLEELEALLLN